MEWEDVEIIKGRIPQLDHVRSLKVRILPSGADQNLHPFGDCAARLLTAFNNLRYLRLDFDCFLQIKKVRASATFLIIPSSQQLNCLISSLLIITLKIIVC